MKDPKRLPFFMILLAMIAVYIVAGFFDSPLEGILIVISYIAIFFCSASMYVNDSIKTSDIRPGCMFEIISKHEKGNVYSYLLQVRDHIYFVQGEMDLGEEGKEYVMGNHRGTLKAFPV